MRVLLTGATGYIGESVLDTFVRAGHAVTALVRNPARLPATFSERVSVLAADLAEPGSWAGKLQGFDLYVHTAFESSARGPAVDRGAAEALVAAGRQAAAGGRQAAVIYTSGVWVIGATTVPAGEDALPAPVPLVSWRPAVEQFVLDASGDGLRTAVIRPGIVFGGSRGIVGDLLKDASNGLVRVVGAGQNRWPLVYQRDLADLYLRIAVTAGASGVFHATDDSDERVVDIVEAISSHTRHRPDVRHIPIEEARAKQGPYADAIMLDQVVRSPRSRALGWEPEFRSITANVSNLFEEWRRGVEAEQ
ncbi:MAG: NAD(P)H-binding protein [Vicinamibacterales bacterium]|nr:NAD(P)H-binding protein [Vicinamibacterales bacterium]